MERKPKENMINLHCHIFETKEFNKANFTPYQFLYLQKALADLYDRKMITNCGAHNSPTVAKQVWDEYNKHPEMHDDVELFVQSEYTVDLSTIYANSPFEKIHMLAAAKKGKEKEFFDKTEVFSKWADMYISKDIRYDLKNFGDYPKSEEDVNNYMNVGTMMIAARNILCQKYCKDETLRIPFDIYKDTIERGLTYNEIRERFVNDSFNYLVSKGLIENTEDAKKKLYYDISFINKLSVAEKISNFAKDVEYFVNESSFMKENGKTLPKNIFDGIKTKKLKFDDVRQEVIDILLVYLINNSLISTDESTIKALTESIELIAKRNKSRGLVPIFREIDDDIKKIEAGLGNKLPRAFGHPSLRLDLRDLNILFGDTAYFCLAHPNEEIIRPDAKLPASYFKNVDISTLPEWVKKRIESKLWIYKRSGEDYMFTLDEENPIIELCTDSKDNKFIKIVGDDTRIVKDEMLISFLDRVGKRFNFNIDAVELSKKMFFETADGKNLHSENAWAHFDMYLNHEKAVNCVSSIGDIHYDYLNDLALINEKMSYKKNCRNFHDDITYYCTDCSWYNLLKTGTFDKENQNLSVRFLKKYLSNKYAKIAESKERTE